MSTYLPGQSHQLLLAITVFYSQRAARRENVSIIKYHTSNPICPPEGKGFHKGSYLDLLISPPIFAIKPQYSPQPLYYLWVFFPMNQITPNWSTVSSPFSHIQMTHTTLCKPIQKCLSMLLLHPCCNVWSSLSWQDAPFQVIVRACVDAPTVTVQQEYNGQMCWQDK